MPKIIDVQYPEKLGMPNQSIIIFAYHLIYHLSLGCFRNLLHLLQKPH